MIAIDTLINRNALDAIARDWLKLVKSYILRDIAFWDSKQKLDT